MYGKALVSRSQPVSFRSTSRALGPARFTDATPLVIFVTCTSHPFPTSHHSSHCWTKSRLPVVVVRNHRFSDKREVVPSSSMIPASSHNAAYLTRPGRRSEKRLVYTLSRSFPVSRPLTSSLPSVLTSMTPARSRTARYSSSTHCFSPAQPAVL